MHFCQPVGNVSCASARKFSKATNYPYGSDASLRRRATVAQAVVQPADSSTRKKLQKLPGLSPIPILGDQLTMIFQRNRMAETMKKNKSSGQMWTIKGFGSGTVFVHDAETVSQIQASEHDLVTTVREGALGDVLSQQTSLVFKSLPDHAVLRQAYFKVLSNPAQEKYLPAIYDAVCRNLEASAKSSQPLRTQYKESAALILAMLTSRYEPGIAEKMADIFVELLALFPKGRDKVLERAPDMSSRMHELIRLPAEAAMQAEFSDKDADIENGAAGELELSSSMLCNMRRACLQAGYLKLEGKWPQFAMAQIFDGSFTVPHHSLYLISAFGRFTGAAEKLREEQASVAQQHGGQLTWQALEDCQYGKRFVKEVLRMGHLLTMLPPRYAVKDLNIDGQCWEGKGAVFYQYEVLPSVIDRA